ncbi:DUF1366 domain-containing protein [Aerococcaceae bacterium NML160702]|nr:DUF1366 domain-containing protein [Aerococcaceae bacterium NML160702]
MIFKIKHRFHKHDEQGKVIGTYVEIINDEGDALTAIFNEKALTLPELEIIEQVKEAFYRRCYVNRAEKEAIASVKAEINAIKTQALAEVNEEVDKVKELVRVVSLTVNELIASFEEAGEDEEATSEDNEI